jgi:hypothetical protein
MRVSETIVMLWEYKLIDDKQAVTLADQIILESNGSYEDNLNQISLHGIKNCLKERYLDLTLTSTLSFNELFALYMGQLDVNCFDDVIEFIRWINYEGVAEEIKSCKAEFAYEFDHLVYDCGHTEPAKRLFLAHYDELFEVAKKEALLINLRKDLNKSVLNKAKLKILG